MSLESAKVIFTVGLDTNSARLVSSAFDNEDLVSVHDVEPTNLFAKLARPEKFDLIIVDPVTKGGLLDQTTLELLTNFRKIDQITPIMILSPFITPGLILRAVRMNIQQVMTQLNLSSEEFRNSAMELMA